MPDVRDRLLVDPERRGSRRGSARAAAAAPRRGPAAARRRARGGGGPGPVFRAEPDGHERDPVLGHRRVGRGTSTASPVRRRRRPDARRSRRGRPSARRRRRRGARSPTRGWPPGRGRSRRARAAAPPRCRAAPGASSRSGARRSCAQRRVGPVVALELEEPPDPVGPVAHGGGRDLVPLAVVVPHHEPHDPGQAAGREDARDPHPVVARTRRRSRRPPPAPGPPGRRRGRRTRPCRPRSPRTAAPASRGSAAASAAR